MDFTAVLHSYSDVLGIAQASLEGLAGCRYLDKVEANKRKVQSETLLRIAVEVDRTYLDAQGACTINDDGRSRQIRVVKEGSCSTVVWNPWYERARQLVDFPDEGYQYMLCAEIANAASDFIELVPGASHTLAVSIEAISRHPP